jgi:hypothetical protein
MTTTTVALVLASVALVVAATTAVLALVVMRQSGRALTEIRHHRQAHQRTHGRADPDPEHHGTSPTVERLSEDVETLGGLYEDLVAWARGADQRLRRPDDQPNGHPATTAMPATDRPGVRRP